MKTNHFKHIFLSFLAFICWISIILCVAAYAFLTTPWGARIASTYLIEMYLPFCHVNVGDYEGTIEKGLVLKNVTINNIPNIQEGIIHIQNLFVQIPLIRWDQLFIKVNNASLHLPAADPIVFNVQLNKNQLSGNCYARSVDTKQFLTIYGRHDLAKFIYGFVTRIDLDISGTINEPRFVGHFLVDKIVFRDTQVIDGFGNLDVKIPSLKEQSLVGIVTMQSAAVKIKQVNVDLTASRVIFKGPTDDFDLDIHGYSKVEDINIDLAIKGTFLKPLLLVSSDPPMAERDILVALATNNAWSDMDESQGFGLRRKLGETFNVGMQVEERQSPVGRDQNLGYSRTLGGQMNVTDKLSVNVARKYLPANRDATTGVNSSTQTQKDNESQIYLQYKQRF
jgi:hypothetical protein